MTNLELLIHNSEARMAKLDTDGVVREGLDGSVGDKLVAGVLVLDLRQSRDELSLIAIMELTAGSPALVARAAAQSNSD